MAERTEDFPDPHYVQQQKNKKKKKKDISPTHLLSLGKFYSQLLIDMEIIIIICV